MNNEKKAQTMTNNPAIPERIIREWLDENHAYHGWLNPNIPLPSGDYEMFPRLDDLAKRLAAAMDQGEQPTPAEPWHARDTDISDRHEKMRQLHAQGYSIRQIAKMVGVRSPRSVHRVVSILPKYTVSRTSRTAEELLAGLLSYYRNHGEKLEFLQSALDAAREEGVRLGLETVADWIESAPLDMPKPEIFDLRDAIRALNPSDIVKGE